MNKWVRRAGLALMGLLTAAPSPGADSAAALEARRLCLEERRQDAVVACRKALELGLSPRRAGLVRDALAVALVDSGRGQEAVDVYREMARLQPDDPEAHLRLGAALLYLGGDPAEAASSLQASLHLRPQDERAYGELGVAESALGQYPEAVAAFMEAERLDPDYFRNRPAARLTFEAAQRSERWP